MLNEKFARVKYDCEKFANDREMRNEIAYYFDKYDNVAPEDIATFMCKALHDMIWDIAEERMELEVEEEEEY